MYQPTPHDQPTDHEGAAALLNCMRQAAELYRQIILGSVDPATPTDTFAEAAVGLVVLLHDLVERRPELNQDLAELMLAAEIELESVPLDVCAEDLALGDRVRLADRWGRVTSHRADHLGFVHIALDDGGPSIALHHLQSVVVERPELSST